VEEAQAEAGDVVNQAEAEAEVEAEAKESELERERAKDHPPPRHYTDCKPPYSGHGWREPTRGTRWAEQTAQPKNDTYASNSVPAR